MNFDDLEVHQRGVRRAITILDTVGWLVAAGLLTLTAYAIHGWLGAP